MAEKLTLYKPITPFTATQYFGEDLTCVDEVTGTHITRLTGGTCPQGSVSLYRAEGLAGHNGLDIKAVHGQPIYAATEGTVERIQDEVARGLGVEIVSTKRYRFDASLQNDSGEYYAKTVYWHLLSFNVAEGDTVRVGQLIGWADNTGTSSGDHLHFELKAVDRTPTGKLYNVFQDNGYRGAIDPTPYLSDLSALERASLITRIRYLLADLLTRGRVR